MASAADDGAPESSPRSAASRNSAMYKNKGMTGDQLRRRRETDTVQLRKQKRDTEFCKRRNMEDCVESSMDDDARGATLTESPRTFQFDPLELFNEETLNEIFSDDVSAHENAMKTFKRCLITDEQDAPLDEAIALGLIARFVTLLAESPSESVRRDCLHVLSSIVCGSALHTDGVVQGGVVPVLIQLLSSEDDELRSMALLALGNIAGDQCVHRDLCIQSGAVPAVLRVLNASTKSSETRSAVWTISNLCRGKNPPPDFEKVSAVLPSMSKQLFSQDPYIVADACRAVALLSEGPNAHIEVVVQSGVVRRVVELLLHPGPSVAAAALRAVGNIVTGTDQQTQVVLSCSALSCLQKLLLSGKEATRKEVCWTLSNILAGNRKQIQAVIDAHILPLLIQVLSTSDFKTRKEACWAISNALSGGSSSQVAAIVREGAVLPLCDLLTVMEPRIVNVALNALDNILKHGETIKSKSKSGINPYCVLVDEAGGVEKLEFLQQSPNLEIYVKAFEMIENYFAGDEHEDDVPLETEKPAAGEAPVFSF